MPASRSGPEERQRASRCAARLTFQPDSLAAFRDSGGGRGLAAAGSLIKNLRYLPAHTATETLIDWLLFVFALSVAVQAPTHHIESPSHPLELFEGCD